MSAGSRNIQGRGQAAPLGAFDAHILSVITASGPSRGASVATADAVEVQDSAKPYYGSCNGPTGPCMLWAGHPYEHIRPPRPLVARPVLDERDELLAILRLALPLLKDWPFTRGAALRRPLVARIEDVLARTR